MQIGSVNSTSFGNGPIEKDGYTNWSHDKEYSESNQQNPIVFMNDEDSDEVDFSNTNKVSENANEKKYSKLKEEIRKIRTNISPETCILTTATIILAVTKGKKIADFAMKGASIAAGAIKAGATKASGDINYLIKKISKKAPDKETYFNDIADKVKKAYEKGISNAKKVGMEKPEFTAKIREISTTLLGDNETGNSVASFITDKMGINSPTGLAAASAAGIIGWKAGDKIGDIHEDQEDQAKISKLIEGYFNGVV